MELVEAPATQHLVGEPRHLVAIICLRPQQALAVPHPKAPRSLRLDLLTPARCHRLILEDQHVTGRVGEVCMVMMRPLPGAILQPQADLFGVLRPPVEERLRPPTLRHEKPQIAPHRMAEHLE